MFDKIKVWDVKMLFRLFWGSLGLVLGAFGAFLGAPFVYEQVRGGHLNFQNFFGGTFEPPSWAPRNLQYIHVRTGAVLEAPMAPRSYKGAESLHFSSDRKSEGLTHSYKCRDSAPWWLRGIIFLARRA